MKEINGVSPKWSLLFGEDMPTYGLELGEQIYYHLIIEPILYLLGFGLELVHISTKWEVSYGIYCTSILAISMMFGAFLKLHTLLL